MRRAALIVLATAACGAPDLKTETSTRALSAYCQAMVAGKGLLEVETDYIPHVVACENGNAPPEALKAQAVAARTYLYYKLETSGSINDGQGDQVYTCARAPGPEHMAAAMDTAGEVLSYHGDVIAAFFVAGAIPSAADCVAQIGDSDYSNTEHFVTYNRGLSGSMVHQTTLGFVSATNYRNRGCQSQNGAACLARANTGYHDILTFYYGLDIGIEAATGACVPMPVMPPMPVQSCSALSAGETIVDEAGMCFEKSCRTTDRFTSSAMGLGGHQYTVPVQQAAMPDCTGRWNLSFELAGDYAIAAYVKSTAPKTMLTYRVRHAGVVDSVQVDQAAAAEWAPLGTYRFEASSDQWVELGDDTTNAPPRGSVAVFDAIRVVPADTPSDDPGVDAPGGTAHAGAPTPVKNDAPPATASIVGSGSGGCRCAVPTRASSAWLSALLVLGLVYRERSARVKARERGRRGRWAWFHPSEYAQEERDRRHRDARRRR